MIRKAALIAVIGSLVPMTAHAQEGDAFRGKAFSHQLCAGCHGTEKDQLDSPLGAAPAFQTLIARSEGWTGESFADWLGTRHPVINGVAIKASVAADLLAYIRSLAPPKQHAAIKP